MIRALALTAACLMSDSALGQMSSKPVGGEYRNPYRESAERRRERRPAATAKSSSRARDSRPSQPTGFFISAFYSTADKAEYEGNATVLGQNMNFEATEQTTSAPGLGAGYMYRPAFGFGFNGLVAYEFARKAKGINGSAPGYKITGTYDGNVSTSLVSGVLNGIWSLDTWLYFYCGFNYPFIMTQQKYVKLSGLPGYQIGVGSNLTDRIGVHFEYRVLRMKGRLDLPDLGLEIEQAQLPGFILSVDYSI